MNETGNSLDSSSGIRWMGRSNRVCWGFKRKCANQPMMHCHESQLKQTDDMTIKKYWFFTVRRTLHCASLSEALTLPGTSLLENACRWAAITRTNYTIWHKSMGNLFLKIAQHGNIPGNICHLFYRLDIFFFIWKGRWHEKRVVKLCVLYCKCSKVGVWSDWLPKSPLFSETVRAAVACRPITPYSSRAIVRKIKGTKSDLPQDQPFTSIQASAVLLLVHLPAYGCSRQKSKESYLAEMLQRQEAKR